MELALEKRIDTDFERLMPVDAAPLGDDIVDSTLVDIADVEQEHDTGHWLKRTAGRGGRIRAAALERLDGVASHVGREFGDWPPSAAKPALVRVAVGLPECWKAVDVDQLADRVVDMPALPEIVELGSPC